MIGLENVSKIFRSLGGAPVQALNEFSLEVSRGALVAAAVVMLTIRPLGSGGRA